MNVQIDTAIKRARGYWFVDGFTEIAMGGLLIILAGFLLISMNISQAPFPSWFLSVTGEITILKIVSFLIVILILWWLKDHFTYPRTGFVRGKITVPQILVIIKNMILFLLLPIVGLLIASLLITSTGSVVSSMPVWFPVGLGLIWAILIAMAGEWVGLHRFLMRRMYERFTSKHRRVGSRYSRTGAPDDSGSALLGRICRLPVSSQGKRFDKRKSICAPIAVGGSRLHRSGENISWKNPAHGIPSH